MESATSKISLLEWITRRPTVLTIVVILGSMINYMLRMNVTIAISTMEASSNVINTSANSSSTTDPLQWDKYQRHMILGCFFLSYLLNELSAKCLTKRISEDKVLGGGILTASVLTLLAPSAYYWDYVSTVLVRLILVILLGATQPALFRVANKWILSDERSKFLANIMASSLWCDLIGSASNALTEKLGWASIFYFTGCISLIWSVVWFLVVYSSPAPQTRYSAEERKETETQNVLWKDTFTSPLVWVIAVIYICSGNNQILTFFKNVLCYNIKQNEVYSNLSYLGAFMPIMSNCLANLLDKKENSQKKAVRKSFAIFAVVLLVGFMVLQGYFGENSTVSIIIHACSLFFKSAVTVGYLANDLDVASNFSGTTVENV